MFSCVLAQNAGLLGVGIGRTQVRRAIKKQCEQDIAFRQRDTSLRHRMRDFEEHVKRQNADMLAAQQRLDDAAAQLLQLEAAVGQSSSSRRKKLDVDGEQSAWKNQLDVAEDRIRQLTQQLSDARRGQAADPATDGGVESPDVLVLDGGRVHLSHAHFASSSERTEFPKLWAAAGEKALQGLGENDNEDDDTTRGEPLAVTRSWLSQSTHTQLTHAFVSVVFCKVSQPLLKAFVFVACNSWNKNNNSFLPQPCIARLLALMPRPLPKIAAMLMPLRGKSGDAACAAGVGQNLYKCTRRTVSGRN